MYRSTRGGVEVTSMEAILNGLAPNGGLYVPGELPKLDYKGLLNDSYVIMASKLLKAFFPEFSYEELKSEVKEAYKSFDIEEVVRLKECGDAYFLELFHGPTLAFKDLALVVLPRLMRLSSKRLGYERKLTILTATSGDTGGAALNGFKGVDGINIIVLYPNNGVSRVQEAQMHSFKSDNSRVYAVNGNFDSCQSFVKEFFNKHKELSLSSANSINIGRLVPQVVYYFYSYISLVKRKAIALDEKINFSVPTGNFGNIFAAFLAKNMGLPINSLICASNKNDVLTDYFKTGSYDINREFYKTNSPSMDIIISSNLERLLYYANNMDSLRVNELMKNLKDNKKYLFKCPYDYFYGYMANEEKTLRIIREVYDSFGYLIDPHTAVAYSAYMDYKEELKDGLKTIVVSTASPFKFPKSIKEAFNLASDSLEAIKNKFNLEIPKCLNYQEYQKEVLDIKDLESFILGVEKCLE